MQVNKMGGQALDEAASTAPILCLILICCASSGILHTAEAFVHLVHTETRCGKMSILDDGHSIAPRLFELVTSLRHLNGFNRCLQFR